MYLNEEEYQKEINIKQFTLVLNKKRIDLYHKNIGLFRLYWGDNYISVVIKKW